MAFQKKQPQTNVSETEVLVDTPKKSNQRQTKKKYTNKSYRLTDNRSGESFMLKVGKNRRLLVFDEQIGYNRAIRHCPNEKSIFIDEQSEHALVEPIILYGGFLEVSYKNQSTQNFLDMHPDNVLNGGSWFEVIDEEKQAEDDLKNEELVLDIKQTIRDKSKEKDGVFALEMVTGVLLNSTLKASQMGTEELKRVIYREADRNPSYFTDDNGNINIFDDEFMHRKYMVLKGLQDGVFTKSPNSKSILWTKDKSIIATAPKGLDLIDYFADYLSTDEGILVIEEFKRRS